MRKKAYLILAGLIFTSAVFSGCFMWSYVKEGYENFSAYFNTYYNAKAAFQDGLNDVNNGMKEYQINQISGAPQSPFVISPTARQKFDLAVEKASKVLQFYPTSEFTEDCLFIIGISYYYEGDNLRGQRKFIEAESAFPKSKRYAEAQMYYGSMLIKDLNYDEGYRQVLDALRRARKDENKQIAAKSADILSGYFLSSGDTSKAAAYLDSAATLSSGDESAIYACRSGNLYEHMGQYVAAQREYAMALDPARDTRLRFYAKYYLARAQRLERKFYAALGDLSALRGDDKFFQYFPLIEYERATVLYDSGEVSSAVASFQNIDTTYATNEAATRSAFRLANIYLYKVGDYQTALKFYQRSTVHPAVYNVSTKARQMAAMLQDYFIYGYRVLLSDSLYDNALKPAKKNDSLGTEHSQADLDSLYEHAASARQELAGFFLFKLQVPDSAINSYKIIVRTFPNSRVYPSALYTLGEYYYSSGDTANGKKYLQELVQKHPESDYAISACALLGIPPPAVSVDSSQSRYDQAMSFVNHSNPDSAVITLESLVANQKSSIVPKALYALGWIYENKLQHPDSAFVYYKRLVSEYPSSNFNSNVVPALTFYEQVQRDSAAAKIREEKAKQDSSSKLTTSESSNEQVQRDSTAAKIREEKAKQDSTSKLTTSESSNEQVQRDSAAAKMRGEKAKRDSTSKPMTSDSLLQTQQEIHSQIQEVDSVQTIRRSVADSLDIRRERMKKLTKH